MKLFGLFMPNEAEPDQSPATEPDDQSIVEGIESVREAARREDWPQAGEAIGGLVVSALTGAEARQRQEELQVATEQALSQADHPIEQGLLQIMSKIIDALRSQDLVTIDMARIDSLPKRTPG
jgi:hypothetical protein